MKLKNMSSHGEMASSGTLLLNDPPCFKCTPCMDRSNTILQATVIASNMGVYRSELNTANTEVKIKYISISYNVNIKEFYKGQGPTNSALKGYQIAEAQIRLELK